MASSSSLASHPSNYDVFLSFRGKDTRSNFTSHLYAALSQKRLLTFIDDGDLQRGDEIGRSLLQAIQNSSVAVLVFSKDYASSSWCLNELVEIIMCHRSRGQIVIPIFYQVNPSDLRKISNDVAAAFVKHEKIFENSQRWRDALTTAASLRGFDSMQFGDDHTLVNKIVEDILEKRNRMACHYFEHLVGMASRVKEIEVVFTIDPQLNDKDLLVSFQAKLMLNNDALLPSFDIARTKFGILPTITREAIASGIKDQRPTTLVISDEEQSHIGMVEGEEQAESFSAANTLRLNMDPTFIILPNGNFVRSITSWQKGELLGSGFFGTVYEGFTDDGFFFAVKEVSLLDQGSHAKQSILQLEQEISLLRQFKHENIIQYLGTDKDESNLYIFLELATKGSLSRLYEKYHLRDSQVSVYTWQILSGLNYLHDQKVVHRDIKCANILVDASGSVKLADFGLAKEAKFNDVRSSKGTPFWMAPEVVNLRNDGYGLPADIWSVGCTVLEMLTRRPPYSHLEAALFRIGNGEPPEVPDTLSRDAQNFILKCLQVNPNDRPSAAQLLDHPFVQRPS